MKTNEQLQNEFEDALISVYMRQLMEEQGKSFMQENNALRRTGSGMVPQEVDDNILTLFQQTRTKSRQSHKILRRSLVAVCMVVILCGFSYTMFPSVKAWTHSFLIELSSKSVNFMLDEGNVFDDDTSALSNVKIEYIPDGFECCSVTHNPDMMISTWEYQNGDASIIVRITDAQEGIMHSVDTENADNVEYLKIGNWFGLYTEKYGQSLLAYIDEDASKYIDIIGVGVDKTMMLNIAKSIVF